MNERSGANGIIRSLQSGAAQSDLWGAFQETVAIGLNQHTQITLANRDRFAGTAAIAGPAADPETGEME